MSRDTPPFLPLLVPMLLACTMGAVAQTARWDSVYYQRNLFFHAIDCADRMNCGAVGGGFSTDLIVTTDGGVTWRRRAIEEYAITKYAPARPFDVANPAPGTFVVAADSGIVWTTTNGGATFRKVRTPINEPVAQLEMWDEHRGVAASSVGDMYVTTDNWHSFRHVAVHDSLARFEIVELRALGSDSLVVLAFDPDKNKIYLMLARLDGGLWISRPAPRRATSMSVPDARLIVVAGYVITDPNTNASKTVVWTSSDFGVSWQQVLDTTHWSGHGTFEISMADVRFGITYGSFGQAWATTDGGATWESDTIYGLNGIARAFRDIHAFPDGNALAATPAEYIVARRPMIGSVDAPDRELPGAHVDMWFDRTHELLSLAADVDDDIEPMLFNSIAQRVSTTIRHSPACPPNTSCWNIDLNGLAQGVYIVSIPGMSKSLPIIVTD